MMGKILKITSNDLYGNVDDRNIVVFACFEHTKYMNNYVIFAFECEYDKKKLCYGSVHLKEDSIVIFSVKDNVKQYIEQFILEYENDNISEFKILDIGSMEKVELVSYNEMDYDKLELLDNKSIYKEVKIEEEIVKEKKPVFLYILLILLILLAIGLTVLYFKPELFTIKYNELKCNNNLYDKVLELNYDIEENVRFDKDNKVESIDIVRTYTFLDSNMYYEFKDNDKMDNKTKKYFDYIIPEAQPFFKEIINNKH